VVIIDSHKRRMGETDEMSRRITPEFVKRRGEHLKLLEPLETLLRELSPLPNSYDVARSQPPYFEEFTYTEMLGCLFTSPQSSEIAFRVVHEAAHASQQPGFDAVAAVLRRVQMDKYTLEAPAGPLPTRVAFLPGSNVFANAVSRELLVAAIHRYPDMLLKPHPMTHEETLRQLGSIAGYRRILSPMASGWAYLQAADHVHVTTATEMGLYAVLLGKRVHNLSNIRYEATGVFAPFYNLIWDLDPDEAGRMLRRALNSQLSGFVHPEDPQVSEKLKAAFDAAMRLREPWKKMAHEYDNAEYAAMVSGMRGKQDAVRPSGPPERRDPQVPDPVGGACRSA
jgi:hypothetical protein